MQRYSREGGTKIWVETQEGRRKGDKKKGRRVRGSKWMRDKREEREKGVKERKN